MLTVPFPANLPSWTHFADILLLVAQAEELAETLVPEHLQGAFERDRARASRLAAAVWTAVSSDETSAGALLASVREREAAYAAFLEALQENGARPFTMSRPSDVLVDQQSLEARDTPVPMQGADDAPEPVPTLVLEQAA